ncbi:choline ABC transporter ATP-binding protein [Curvivirga aplysinae]|uniref:choline ABC transporter ATP-binding protein n=1 Tax=Curvivirga aplysinae TaxID=2529852 RepID=UPI0012BB5C4E|nr:choline ABC transporter ATP-binding protein [Curvivirga aplysinae]MTI08287.1 choline ABC transporter ATP-binding protein [Curvivirga aplysinae]
MSEDKKTSVSFRNVDIMFGEKAEQSEALKLLDAGGTRKSILDETGCVLGTADASIDIKEGEICVLMGLSGSGKSTLLRAVNGLNKVSRGSILVQDGDRQVDIASCDKDTLRHMRTERVAMVFQQFGLLPWRTVEENVGLGLELAGMSVVEREKIVLEKLELVGLAQWKDKYAHELSGGMQQRVGLARAFATDADILLMDEPFSALDPLIRNQLQDFLLGLQKDLNKTIIFVSHDLDEALKLGNHIAIMEEGRIVQYGEPEDIVLNPANAYVAEFVAHMNPLNVLQGASFMTPLNELDKEGDKYIANFKTSLFFSVDGAGSALDAQIYDDAQSLAIKPISTEEDVAGLNDDCIVVAPSDMKMRWMIEIRHRTSNPILLSDGEKIVGLVGDDEIYAGILRQTSLGQEEAA